MGNHGISNATNTAPFCCCEFLRQCHHYLQRVEAFLRTLSRLSPLQWTSSMIRYFLLLQNLPNYGFVFSGTFATRYSGNQFKIQTSFGRFLPTRYRQFSFDAGENNVHTFDRFGRICTDTFHHSFHSRTSNCNPRHQLQVTPLLIFGAKRN